MQALLSLIAEHIGKPVPQLMNNALRAWTDRNWKGNARELRHCLEQAVTLNDGPPLNRKPTQARRRAWAIEKTYRINGSRRRRCCGGPELSETTWLRHGVHSQNVWLGSQYRYAAFEGTLPPGTR